jgi:hypothetical protein
MKPYWLQVVSVKQFFQFIIHADSSKIRLALERSLDVGWHASIGLIAGENNLDNRQKKIIGLVNWTLDKLNKPCS